MCTDYNGYPNQASWLVALWIDNEQAMSQDVAALTVAAEGSIGRMADLLQEYIVERLELDEASMRADLLNWALALVDWRHLAENYLGE